VFEAIADAAAGQPRKALTILQSAYDLDDPREVARITHIADATDPVIKLMQFLLQGKKGGWREAQRLLGNIEDFEDVLEKASGYLPSAITKMNNPDAAHTAWQILDALVYPTTGYNKRAIFIAAIGRAFWGD